MNEKIELDEKKLNMMKLKILQAERENLKTQEKTPIQMADKVRNIIIEEVKKSF